MVSEMRTKLYALRQCCYPFSLLTGHRALEAIDAVRAFELRPGEQLTLQAGSAPELLYVLEGEVALTTAGAGATHLSLEETRSRPFRIQPGGSALTVTALSAAVLCRVDGDLLDYLLSWEALGQGVDIAEEDTRSRVATVRRSVAFCHLPLEYVEEAFRRMTRLSVEAGQEIVRQGDPGDAFYVIESGRAEVWQTGLYDDAAKLVAELGPGDPFGEEALVLKGTRNATVRMAEAGSLLMLCQGDFDELFSRPLIQHVDARVAMASLESGHVPLDVRYQEEFDEGHLPGALLLPLQELRKGAAGLDRGRQYVVYCRSGRRSAAAALLLRQRSFDAVSLKGGIQGWPYEIVTG